jgi:uncharacterized Zn finger protein (UPF0148 family)
MHCVKCGAPTFPSAGSTPSNTLCPRCKNKQQHAAGDAEADRRRQGASGVPAHAPTVHEEPTVRTGPVKLTDFPRYRSISGLIARLKTASTNEEYQGVLADLEGQVNTLAAEGLGPKDSGPIEPVMVAPPAPAPHANNQPPIDPIAALVGGEAQS